MYTSNLARNQAIPLFSRVSIRSKCCKGNGFDPLSLSIQFHHPRITLIDDSVPRALSRNFSSGFARRTVKESTPKLNPKNPLVGARVFSTAENGGFATEKSRKPLPWIAAYKNKERHREGKRAAVKTSRSSWADSAQSYFSRNEGRSSSNEIVESKDGDIVDDEISGSGRNREVREKRRDFYEEKSEKRAAVKTSRSSWADSGQTYFSRNEGRSSSNEIVESKDRDIVDDDISTNGRNREIREKRKESYEEKSMNEEEDIEPVDDPRWDGIKSKYKRFVDREPRFERPEVRRWNKEETWGRKVWKEAKESSIPKMVGQGVYGVGPVLAALTVERREFFALYVQEGLDLSGNNKKKKDKKGIEKVLKLAEKVGLKVIEASKHDLNMMVDSRPHQGLVLDASPLELVNIKDLEIVSSGGQRAPVWVALDEVTDPQNLGAIVRSAYFFGVQGVVLCAKNSAPLSGVVSKASAGSLELIELRSCRNMMQFLSSSVENGWRVLGGSVSSKARPLSDVEDGVPTILVLGSEGSGLRPLVERSCTDLVRIPGSTCTNGSAEDNEFEDEETDQSGKGQELKSFLAVESLNVSVAAGVLLYHLAGKNSHLDGQKATTVL